MCTAICRLVCFFSLLGISTQALAVTRQVSVARKLYKEGQYQKAAEIYAGIDSDSRDYLRTREELAWSYLRAGDWAQVRGVLAHLNSTLVPLRFRLEGRVMAAMLHLRDCQYEAVKSEMDKFQEEMRPFVRTVTRMSRKSDNRDYWLALRSEVDEALFKMKFVRMELRGRLLLLSRNQIVEGQSTAPLVEELPTRTQTFPITDELWVDELFRARGEGISACVDLHNPDKKVTR
ncbi:MAG: tetratricopeptide repeat protein [Bdellovibrionales bacterium]